MGDIQYPTRLRWHHTLGVARHDGVSVGLRQAPAGLLGCSELDFIPNVIAQIRYGADAMRDMTTDERVQAMALLIRMANEAHAAVTGQNTLVTVNTQ